MAATKRPTFLKRQKEQARLARAAEKRQARLARRLAKRTATDEGLEPESMEGALAQDEGAEGDAPAEGEAREEGDPVREN